MTDDRAPELMTGGCAMTLDMTAEQKRRARAREARVEREGFGFARVLRAGKRRRKGRARS